jgi:poly(3-hydroxybutyrate) depolymerase
MVVVPEPINGCWNSFENFGYCFDGAPEDSSDVDFVENLIKTLQEEHPITPDRVIVPGFSNGGSFAFRFGCQKPHALDGLVINGQAWFDPVVGCYDYDLNQIPPGAAECVPDRKVSFYSAVGTDDWFYGQPPAAPGFEAVEKWEAFSTEVLNCTGQPTRVSNAPPLQAPTICYECPSCPNVEAGVNRMCSLSGVGHETFFWPQLIKEAFDAFFD